MVRFLLHPLDWSVFVLAGIWAYDLRFPQAGWNIPSLYSMLLVEMATVLVLVESAVYSSWRGGRLRAMLGRLVLGWSLTWGVLMAYLVMTKTSTEFSRIWLGTWAGISLNRPGFQGGCLV